MVSGKMYEDDSEKSGLKYLWLAISLVISLVIVVIANLLHQSLLVIVWGVSLFVAATISGFTFMIVKVVSRESKICFDWLSGAICNIIVMAISQMVIILVTRGFK